MLVDTSNPINVGTHRTLKIPRENCGRSYQEGQEPCIKLSLDIRLPDFDLRLHRTTLYPTKHVQTCLGHSMDPHSCMRAGCLLVRTFACWVLMLAAVVMSLQKRPVSWLYAAITASSQYIPNISQVLKSSNLINLMVISAASASSPVSGGPGAPTPPRCHPQSLAAR